MMLRSRVAALLCASLSFFAVGAVTNAHAAGGVAIANLRTEKCLTVDNASTLPGAPIVQRTCGDLPGQHWIFLGSPGGIRQLYNLDTDRCMKIVSFENFGRVVQGGCGTGEAGIFWAITDLGGLPWPQRKIILKSYTTNFCLDLENGDPSEGVELQVWKCDSRTDNQRWRV